MTAKLLRSLGSIQHLLRNRCLTQTNLRNGMASYAIYAHKQTGRFDMNRINKCSFVTNPEAATNTQKDNTDSKKINKKALNVEQLLGRLEQQFRLNGNLSHEEFSKLLNLLEAQVESYNELLSKEQAQFLLSACGGLMPAQTSQQRMQLFQRLWSYLKHHGQLSAEHYRSHLLVLVENSLGLQDYQQFLNEIKQLDGDVAKSSDLYAQLLEVACNQGNMRQASEVLAEMKSHTMALSERNFNTLILGNARNHDLKGVESVLQSMQAADLPLSMETYTVLVIAYLECGKINKALEVLKQHSGQYSAEQVVKILKTFLKLEIHDDILAQLIKEFPKEYIKGITELPGALKNLCIELIHRRKLSMVHSLLINLPKPQFNENQNTDTYGLFLLHEMFRAEIPNEEIIYTAKLLKDLGKNERALHIVTEIALRRYPPNAIVYLETLAKQEPLRPHYFWPLIMYNFRRHGENGILKTLKLLHTLKVECDKETITQYVMPRLQITLENPLEALQNLDRVGVKASLMMTPIIAHLISQHRITDILSVLEQYPTKIETPLLITPLSSLGIHCRATKRFHQFSKVLAAINSKAEKPKFDFIGLTLQNMLQHNIKVKEDIKSFQRLLQEIHNIGLNISSSSIEAIKGIIAPQEKSSEIYKLLQQLSNNSLQLPESFNNNSVLESQANKNNSITKHPRDMTIDELEFHLIELESKGLNARGVLRRLLQLCVRDNRLERALEIKGKCDALKVQESAGMMASTFELYIKLKDLEKAKATLKHLEKNYSTFSLDEHKLLDYAALLIQNRLVEEAQGILEGRAAKHKIAGGDYVLKNVWNYLNSVAQLAASLSDLPAERNLTRDAFKFLQRLHFCGTHNTVLGPIIRERLLRGDIHLAVVDFKQLAEQYKHTPLQFELLSLLVRLSNQNKEEVAKFPNCSAEQAQSLLSQVTEVIAKVHGVTNMNSALLLAFAESGNDNQLRRLLINPEFRINHELLMKNCEHLGEGGAVPTLLRLARCSRGLQNVIDEQSIYNMLLDNFNKTNNYEAALDLYERLELDDELKISSEFLQKLVKLLKVNNVQIPSNIALRAQVI